MHPARTEGPEPREKAALPASPGRALTLAIAAIVISLGAVVWLESRGAESFAGVVETPTIAVASARNGRIAELFVEEGAIVEPGDEVARLVDDDLESRIASKRRMVATLEAALAQATAQAEIELSWRRKSLEAEILENKLKSAELLRRQFEAEIALEARDDLGDEPAKLLKTQTDEVVFIQPLTQRDESLPAKQVRSLFDQESTRNAIEVYAAQVELCDRRIRELEALRVELPSSVRRASGIEAARLRLEDARAQLAELQALEAEWTLTATGYGTAAAPRKRTGERVLGDETIVRLHDDDRRRVAVPVPSRNLAGFEIGAEVTLEFAAGERRTGEVVRIATEADGKAEEGTAVPVWIEPTGRLWPDVPVGASVVVTRK